MEFISSKRGQLIGYVFSKMTLLIFAVAVIAIFLHLSDIQTDLQQLDKKEKRIEGLARVINAVYLSPYKINKTYKTQLSGSIKMENGTLLYREGEKARSESIFCERETNWTSFDNCVRMGKNGKLTMEGCGD